jgi:type I restriction enzyme S subunit
VKAEWITQRLATVAIKITDGSHNPPKGGVLSDYLMLSSKNVFDDDLHYAEPRYLTEEQHQLEDKRTGIVPGDVLLTIVGTVGRSAVVPTDAAKISLQRSVAVIRTKKEIVEPRFMMYSFIERCEELNNLARGVAQKGIYLETLRELEFKFPPLSEQHRIVTLLDEAFAYIATAKANAEKNLQNARELFESHLQTLFAQRGEGWKDKTLEEISTTFGRGKSRHRPRNDPALYGGRYPFVQTGDVRNAEHIITEFSQTYSEAGLAQSKLWPKGTICITIAANIAETGILGFDACFPDSVIGVVPDPKEAEVGYVEYVLQSFKARLQALGQGSAQANINMGTFENERFPFPSVAEQRGIVTKLDALSEESQRLESIYRQKLTSLDNLKKSLLHKAFSGQL